MLVSGTEIIVNKTDIEMQWDKTLHFFSITVWNMRFPEDRRKYQKFNSKIYAIMPFNVDSIFGADNNIAQRIEWPLKLMTKKTKIKFKYN